MGDDEKKIEIHLSDESSNDPKAQRIKSWANVIATTAALLTAVAAINKPQDQTVSKNTYEQLKSAIEHTNQDVKENHDDMVALHNYLLGYYAGDQFALPPLSSIKSITIDAGISAPVPTTAAAATVAAVPRPKHDTITLKITPPQTAQMAAPPQVHAAPVTTVIPDFASASVSKK